MTQGCHRHGSCHRPEDFPTIEEERLRSPIGFQFVVEDQNHYAEAQNQQSSAECRMTLAMCGRPRLCKVWIEA